MKLLRQKLDASVHQRGISLIEVLVVATILTFTATAVVISTTSSMRSTRLSDELRAAAFAAREQMERRLAMSTFDNVKSSPDTFKVFLNTLTYKNAKGSTIEGLELQGIGGTEAGEIIWVDDEKKTASDLGRDLTTNNLKHTPDGNPDGVSLCPPLPMDFNGNGVIGDSNPAPSKLLIGVVIRWISSDGNEQRYELWAVKP